MKNSTKADLALLSVVVFGIAIMVCGKCILWVEGSDRIPSRFGMAFLWTGLAVALIAIIAAAQWKLSECFFTRHSVDQSP
jgi:hypothetical protein